MARPKDGYRLADGSRVPSVTTVLGRFKESGGLIAWAWKLGTEGKDYREVRDAAADAGTLAHSAVEAWIHGEVVAFESPDDTVNQKARVAFGAFREWADQTQLKITHTEISLISEKHRFGGTLDAMLIRGKRSLGDWKSSNGIYPEYLCQIAAYKLLWEENYPDMPVEGGLHLLRFDKTFGDFTHKWWAELEVAERQFLLLREAYENDKELRQRIK